MILLRDIKENDLEKVMEWRMRPDITKWMNTDPVLTIDMQRQWYEKINKETNSIYKIIVIDGVDVGVVNITDITDECALWGYYMAENSKRSFKNAISLELSLYKYCFEVLGVKSVRNEALAINKGVIKLHQMCGNHIVETKKDAVIKCGQKYDVVVMETDKQHFEEVSKKTEYEIVDFSNGMRAHHIGYIVKDLEKAEASMSSMGYEREGEIVRDERRGIDILFLKHDKSDRIEFIKSVSDKSDVAAIEKRMNGMPMPYHICYEVENVIYLCDVLKYRGFRKISDISPAVAIDGRNVCFLHNSNIGMIELVEKGR